MTTNVVHSIGSGIGRDYTTIGAWYAACPGDLTAVDQVWIGEVYDDGEIVSASTVLSIGGTVTDATRFVWLRAASGASFVDKVIGGAPLTYDGSQGVAIRASLAVDFLIKIGCAYTQISGLQLKNVQGTTYTNGGCIDMSAGGSNVHNNLAYVSATNYNVGAFRVSDGVYQNCLAIVHGDATGFVGQGAYNHSAMYQCTAYNTGGVTTGSLGFNKVAFYGSMQAYSCVALGFASDFHGGNYTSSDYCVSSDASAPGAHSTHSGSLSNEYNSVTFGAEDFRVKAGADIIGKGAAFSFDILGTAVSPTTPTAGCYEYVASGGGATAKFRRSLSALGARIGSRQQHRGASFAQMHRGNLIAA